MNEPTNRQRADWAYEALRAFAKETNQDNAGDLLNDAETVIADLVADLMHLCDAMRFDVDVVLERAKRHYLDEYQAARR